MPLTRRTFLAGTAGIVGAGGLIGAQQAEAPPQSTDSAGQDLPTPPSTRKGDMLYRALGRTGQEVSLIGLGGFHIGKQRDEQESIRLIRTAIDRGITFLDNCWDYNNGQSEIRMGKALLDGYRQKVFLMTKIDGRTREAAARQIDQSLQRFQTDHIDLVQHHEIIRMEDPDRIFAKGGAMEATLDAKKAGKLRFIGFTGHKDPLVHLRMLEVARQHDFHFDTAQMPINIMDAQFRSFQHQVLPVLLKEGIGPLAMKTFADHAILDAVLKAKLATPIELLHFSMTRPVCVVITGIDRMEILDQAIEAVKTFQPMTRQQIASLLDRTRSLAMTGQLERFKTTSQFDGTAHHPEWLG